MARRNQNPEVTSEETSEDTSETSVGTKGISKVVSTKIERIKEALANQPRKSIIIPLEASETKGKAFETVQINGYILQIMKGVYVDVPEQVADILMESQKQTMEAVEEAKRKLPASERIELDNSN